MCLSGVLIPNVHKINGDRSDAFLFEDNVSSSRLRRLLLVEWNGLSTILAGQKMARASTKIFLSPRPTRIFTFGIFSSEKRMSQTAKTDLTRFALCKLSLALHTAGTKGRSVLDLERALPSSWSSHRSQGLGRASKNSFTQAKAAPFSLTPGLVPKPNPIPPLVFPSDSLVTVAPGMSVPTASFCSVLSSHSHQLACEQYGDYGLGCPFPVKNPRVPFHSPKS